MAPSTYPRVLRMATWLLLISTMGKAAKDPKIRAIVNGASYAQTVAGGSIASLFGENLATSLKVAVGPPYPSTLGDISLTVGGYPAALFAVSPTQINFQMPWEVLGQNQTTIQLTAGGTITSTTVNLVPFSPGLFATSSRGTGQGAVLIAGARIAAPVGAFSGSRPARPGEFLEIYATGLGPVAYGPATGQGAAASPSATTLATPEVTFGGVPASVSFSGLAPGFVGLYQVNVQLPSNAPSGDAVELKVSIPGGGTSNAVTVAIQQAQPGSVSVKLAPSAASVQIGNTLSFAATVADSSNAAITWSVDDPSHGSIDSQGNYQAPTNVPAGSIAIVTATSAADSTKYASALVTITGASGKPVIAVSPQDATLILGGMLQFKATVTGTSNTAVTWTTDIGSIDATGLLSIDNVTYAPFYGQVTATLQADPTVTASAYFYPVPPLPVLTGISPASAGVGQQVQLLGENFGYSTITVYFTGPNGLTIPVYPDGNPIVVPVGAVTGPVYVQVQANGLSTVRSNAVLFTRQPRLLLHAQQNDLAAGESVQVAARFLGASTPQPLVWTADQGAVVGGQYTAPVSLQADGFAHVTACFRGTQSCDTVVLGLHPFRIDPANPVVQAGTTLQLSAVAAGSQIAPVWSIEAGGGSLVSSGLFTAPSDSTDSGGIPISATYQGISEESSVAVTNSFPGMVNRAYQYGDRFPNGARVKYSRSLQVLGNRAYVMSSDAEEYFNATDWWIDVYDISDPSHPVWLDAVEAALYGSEIYLDSQNQLLAQVDQYRYPGRLAVYDLTGGSPVAISLVQTPSFPVGTASFNAGRVFSSGIDGVSGPIQIYIFNALTGMASTVALPQIPGAVNPTGTANRMYVGYYANPGEPLSVAAFDTSTQPFTLLGTAVGGSYPTGMRMFGQLLFVDGGVIDTTNDQLVKVADLGSDRAVDLSQTGQLLVQPGLEFRVDILDMNTPSRPVPLGSISPLTYETTVRWSGKYILSAEGFGGMGVYLASPNGGPVPKGTIPLGPVGLNALAANPPYLYSGTIDGLGNGVVGISNVTAGTYLLGRYTEPSDPPLALLGAGNNLIVGSQKALTILDISNPAAPSKLSSLALPTASLAVAGHTLFAGTLDSALTVVDVTQPGSPKVTGRLPLTDVVSTLRVTGHLLLAADNTGGFVVVDITSPGNPVIVSRTPFSSLVTDLAVDGNLALLAEGDGGLVILDLTNPVSPAIVSQTPLQVFLSTLPAGALAPFATAIVTQDQVAYVGSACGEGSIFGFDYRESAHPRLVSLAGYGEEIVNPVGPLLFFGSDLLVGISRFDYSHPRNVIVQNLMPKGLRSPPESCLTYVSDVVAPAMQPYLRNGSRGSASGSQKNQ